MKLRGNEHTSMRKWKKEEVVAFLQHSYSKFKYRNVGLISQMSYELQLPFKPILQWTWEDIYMLIDGTWDENLVKLIDKQKEVFGFQPLVAPQITPIKGEYVPYTKFRFSKVARKIIDESPNLDKELLMRYLPLS